MFTAFNSDRPRDMSEDELLRYVFDLSPEDLEARREAEAFFAAIGSQDPDTLPEMDDSLRRIHEKSMRLIRQLDGEREGFEGVVADFYRGCVEDSTLAGSAEFSQRDESELIEQCEHALTGVSRILEDRLPMTLRRERNALLRVDWTQPEGLAYWEQFRDTTAVPLLAAARHAAEHEGGFETCAPQLAARIVDAVRSGALDLPGFVRRDSQGEETVFLWTPPEVLLSKDQTSGALPISEAPDEELQDAEIELLEKAPVLAWLRGAIQTRLLLAEAISGRGAPPATLTAISEPLRRSLVDQKQMAACTHALVASLTTTQSLPRERIVRELGQQAILRLRTSLHEGNVEAVQRSAAAAESFWEML